MGVRQHLIGFGLPWQAAMMILDRAASFAGGLAQLARVPRSEKMTAHLEDHVTLNGPGRLFALGHDGR